MDITHRTWRDRLHGTGPAFAADHQRFRQGPSRRRNRVPKHQRGRELDTDLREPSEGLHATGTQSRRNGAPRNDAHWRDVGALSDEATPARRCTTLTVMKKRMPRAKHVVLISVDGLQPIYYLDDKWPAPAMQQLYREGAHAVAVTSGFPALTYPGHTTLVTGALPARHGICHNKHFEPVADPPWLKDASLIKVPTLWDAVRARGGTTAAVLWPLTAGAAIDWNLPDIWPGGDGDLIAALRGHDRPHGFLEELEREATGRLSPQNFNNRWLSHDLRVALLAEYLFER